MYGLLGQNQMPQGQQGQGLLGDWRQSYAGYQPPPQNVAPPNVQAQQYAPGYWGYGLSPEYIGLLSQTFDQQNWNPQTLYQGQQTADLASLIQQLQSYNNANKPREYRYGFGG